MNFVYPILFITAIVIVIRMQNNLYTIDMYISQRFLGNVLGKNILTILLKISRHTYIQYNFKLLDL